MKLRVGIIGLGYWGPNYVRNFIKYDKTEVLWGCDKSDSALQNIHSDYPFLKLTKNYKELLNDSSLQCVAIATPPETHYQIAKMFLEANKHIFIAKPLATNFKEAEELLKIAKRKNLMLFGDLTYLYTGAIRFIKKYIKQRGIGIPFYYDSIRSNLGLIQKEINVVWDLAPHDFSIIDYFFDLQAEKVIVSASRHHKYSRNDEMAHITVTYSNNFVAHIHLSWLSPIKQRMSLIGGTKKMILFDDIQFDEKVKIYDKSIHIPSSTITPFKPVYRIGDIVVPKIENEEALYLEIVDFVKQIIDREIHYDNARRNVKIVKLLEACDKSIQLGKQVYL